MLVLERTVCCISVAYVHDTAEEICGIFELLCNFVGKGVIFFKFFFFRTHLLVMK